VKRSLLHKATGYSYHGEKIFYDRDLGVVRVPVVEHVPPSDTAMILYLNTATPSVGRIGERGACTRGLAYLRLFISLGDMGPLGRRSPLRPLGS
jgi:hypothetical protein